MLLLKRAGVEHAAEISRLLRLCYKDSYPKPELYEVSHLAQMLRNGLLVSVLAMEGELVVGHYALEIDNPPTLAQTGMALVDPAFRGGGLMHMLRQAVEDLATEVGLEAIYGTAVTTHARSQAAYDRLNNVPTGILTGMAQGVSFQNLEITAQSDLTLVHYHKQLKPVLIPPLLCPSEYRALLADIVEALGLAVTWAQPGEGTGGGFVPAEAGLGRPRCLWGPGFDDGSRSDWVDFPMDENGWLPSFQRCRQQGFRFAAFVPLTAEGRFRLRLQKTPPDQDWDNLDLHHPLARRIRDFMARETV